MTEDDRPFPPKIRDGNAHQFQVTMKLVAFWCDDLKRWVLNHPLHLECLPARAVYIPPNPECEYCHERHDPRLACPEYARQRGGMPFGGQSL